MGRRQLQLAQQQTVARAQPAGPALDGGPRGSRSTRRRDGPVRPTAGEPARSGAFAKTPPHYMVKARGLCVLCLMSGIMQKGALISSSSQRDGPQGSLRRRRDTGRH
jgi:hypothetical protein